MSIILPKFGLKAVSETSRFKDLGRELREMGQSIETILESFNYNGADPNTVLARVAALEAWRVTTQAKLSALTNDTGWVNLAVSGGTGVCQYRIKGDEVFFQMDVSVTTNMSGDTQWDLVTTIPTEACPSMVQALGAFGGSVRLASAAMRTNGTVVWRQQSSTHTTRAVASGSWPKA